MDLNNDLSISNAHFKSGNMLYAFWIVNCIFQYTSFANYVSNISWWWSDRRSTQIKDLVCRGVILWSSRWILWNFYQKFIGHENHYHARCRRLMLMLVLMLMVTMNGEWSRWSDQSSRKSVHPILMVKRRIMIFSPFLGLAGSRMWHIFSLQYQVFVHNNWHSLRDSKNERMSLIGNLLRNILWWRISWEIVEKRHLDRHARHDQVHGWNRPWSSKTTQRVITLITLILLHYLNRKCTYRNQLRTFILDFVVIIIYFLIATMLLARNILYLILSLLVEASSHLQCRHGKPDGNIGFTTRIRTCPSHRVFQKTRFIKSSLALQSRTLQNDHEYLEEYKRRRQEFYDSTSAILEDEWCSEHSKMTNSLNDDEIIDWSLEKRERERVLNIFSTKRLGNSKDVINRSANVDENAGNQDIGFNINRESNASRSTNTKRIPTSIILESFQYSKLSSTNFNSIEIRSFDTIKMSESVSDNSDINKSSITSIAIHLKTILIRSSQNDVLYFNKINIIGFFVAKILNVKIIASMISKNVSGSSIIASLKSRKLLKSLKVILNQTERNFRRSWKNYFSNMINNKILSFPLINWSKMPRTSILISLSFIILRSSRNLSNSTRSSLSIVPYDSSIVYLRDFASRWLIFARKRIRNSALMISK